MDEQLTSMTRVRWWVMLSSFILQKMNGAKATAVLSLLAVCLLAPLTVSADDSMEEYSFVDTKSNYTARLSGGNSVTIQLPLYDLVGWHADRWVKEGKLYYIIVDDDGKESQPKELLQWGNSGAAVDDDATKVPTYINVTDNGEFDITPGVGNPFILPNTSTGSKTKDFYTERRTNVGYWCIYVDWTVPKNIQGKKVKFRWDATIYVNGALNLQFDYVIFNISTISDLIDLPEGSNPYNPTLSQPIISLDNVGKILVPWYITAQTVVNACAYYTDSNNEVHSIPLEANSNGYIPLPATERHKDVYVNVSYKDYYGYIFADRQSEKTDVPMLHAPLNFRATPVDDGKGSVLLEWEIGDNDFKDYYDNDFFEIQRSVTGKEEDYEALTVVLFDNEATHYSLKDSTLLSSLAGEVKNPKYRIRRMVTEIWGWKDNPTKAEAKASLFPMRLLTPSTPHAEWESEREHKVKVTWDYVNSDTYQNIWDNRAEIKIRVNMYNRSKELVETTETTLTNEDINKKEKVLSLTRSCVNYRIEMVCDPKSSPFDFSQGKETLEGIKIFTIDDWRALKELVATEESDRTKTVYLMADITLGPDDGIGTSDRPFTGMFDGRGRTITIKNAPPIHYAWSATILNLKIAGEIDGSGDAAGLVHAGSFVTIENCIMEANFTNVIENSAFAYDMTSKVTITNSLFAGKVIQNSTNSKWYGFVPAIKRGNYNIQNCLSAIAEGSTIYDYYLNTGVFGVNFVYQSSTTPKINVSNNYYTGTNYFTSQSDNNGERIATEPTQLLAALGSGWTTSDEWPGVKPVTPGITREYTIITIPVSAAAPDTTFYFQSSGKVEKTLNVQKRQSSVLLTWNTDGGVIDYFQVLRRKKGSGTDLEIIAPNVETTSYEDKDVSPLLEYEYCVRSAVDCEGMTYQYTDTMAGACEHTGMVEGYVRYPDGTGAGGIQVDITHDNHIEQTVFTEEDGHFEAKGLPYYGGTSVSYRVSPVSKTNLGLQPASQGADFNGEYNYYMLDAFVITTGVRFSGYVMYAGTSIPVKGARFLVNGKELRNTNGMPLESDFDGKVSFYVNSGNNVIQAVMDGHTFTNDGYYKSSEGYEFKENVSQVYFYDETKVKLIGRIVGGDKQGNLPLDNNLSHNNLGIGVKMVLTLEGDNSSWLVYDNKNPEISTRDEVIPHKVNDANTYKTKVHITRKRMEVSPDSISGEYTLYLPPVRWKVQQVYSYGYPTLFQEGMVSEVIDLTNSITEQADTIAGNFTTQGGQTITNPVVRYHAKYSRIYHTPVELLCRQVVYDDFDYFGDKNYISRSVGSKSVTVPLAWADSTGTTHYTFGHPMFSLDRSYPVKLNAVERYYWNNNRDNDTIDVVKVGGGKVTIQNGLISGTHKDMVELDDNGEAYYSIKAKQATYLLQGKDALRTVTITLEQDGTTYEAERIQGYVFNIFSTPGTKDLLNVGTPMLFDILRDPPGGGSSATLHKGSTLTNSYSVDMSIAFKGNISIATGSSLTSFTGTVLESGLAWGLVDSSDHSTMFDTAFGLDYEGNRSFSYTMNVNEDISTSSDPTMTGAAADLYIGGVNNIVVSPAYTIRAIPDSTFQHFKAMTTGATLPTGEVAQYTPMTVIASGTDANNNLYHLVSDQSLSYGSTVSSRFVYSQKYILDQLIPSLVEQCRSLMFIGTAAEAQTRANATGMPVYRSLLEPTDPLFGIANTKYGEFYYNAGDNAQTSGMSYVIHLPSTNNKEFPDMVQQHWQSVMSWINMISLNEREKLSVRDDELLKNYNLDGGSKVSYSESFSSDYTTSNYMALPLVKTASFSDFWLGIGYTGTSYVFMPLVAKLFEKLSKYTSKDNIQEDGLKSRDGDNNTIEQKVNFSGSSFSFKLKPTFNYSTKGVGKEEKSYNRSESFNIDLNSKSHIDFDIYRVQTHTETPSTISVNDVYTSQNLEDIINLSEGYISREYNTNYWTYPRGFIYRTRGGATARPWEKGYKSLIYSPGTVIDERTKQIENPKIQLDKQSVSGVAYGEPARFKVYLTNESEEPEAATGGLAFYNFYLDETTNPNGAKLFVDGTPLNGSGRSIRLTPGEVTQKTLEVYAGEDFDYEGIVLGVMSQGDFSIGDEVAFDVHFLRQAGGVEISSPGDKWVMNTDAQYNEERGYFIPVVISGFDKHQKNFDHIEFQYKETARGDDYWTNLCSYYADSTLMAKANGVADMIPANGNITTKFYGEGVEMEQAYDLRAVLYCRDGNKFLTTSSKVLSGVKDTRRPRLFGTPEPTDGVLDIGESIVFNFSEDIEYNYLRETTHFEVKGEVNNDNINETVSVLFNGNSSMETEARRNFNNKDVTIDMLIKPDYTGEEDMPLFSHGQGGKKLQLWITKDSLLKAVVNDLEFVSDSVIDGSAFTLVAMVIKQPDLEKGDSYCHLNFYQGGVNIGSFDFKEPYTGTGRLIFGRTNEAVYSNSKFYKGRMKEAKVWYRALDGKLLGNTYGYKRLTGYEMGLVDYYPMDEGSGNYALDKAQGANATLTNTSWAMPKGMSLHLEWEDRGMELTPQALSRTADEDYTLMFWFKTDANGHGALISNGGGHAEDNGAANQFYIGFEGEQLVYRTNGMQVDIPGNFSDNAWHHYAMTVNRDHNIVNIYVDKTLLATFKADSIAGISGGHMLLGGSVYERVENGVTRTIDSGNWLRGNLDEICLFEQALPLYLISNYSTKTPHGDEAGLKTYLAFDRQERQGDNDITFVPYAYSKKIYKDKMGNIIYQKDQETNADTSTPQRDYRFVDDEETVLAHVDQTDAAPVVPDEDLHNLDFDFTGRGNQLLVSINELQTRINRRHVYVTLREIPDKNGNNMASPVTACFYVDRSPLKWFISHETITKPYGEEEVLYFTIENTSSISHTYTIENLPKWITVNEISGIIGPKDNVIITGTISSGLNVGSYDEVIYLRDEDGFAEPFYLTVVVEGEEPQWAVNRELGEYTMNIAGRVLINGEIDTDSRDIVGVFDKEGICHGVAHIDYDNTSYDNLVYLTIYDNKNDGKNLYFKLWNYATGLEMIMQPDTIKFHASATLGLDKPIIFTAGTIFVQNLNLKKGWNWVSFFVYDDKSFRNANGLLKTFPWQHGDIIMDNTAEKTLNYKNGNWLCSDNSKMITIMPKRSYWVYVQNDVKVALAGSLIEEKTQRTIRVTEGWNHIGYTPMKNLSVETALGDYYDFASEGDVIKSHNEFAYFSKYNNIGRWQGNLKYMKPGEGYMLLRKAKTDASFTYPFIEPGSTFIDEWAKAPERTRSTEGNHQSTMSLTAIATGVDMEPGDHLLAYADGELRGVGVLGADSIFYMSIEGDSRQPLWFAIERDDDIIATTAEIATFEGNAVMGTPATPTCIDFTKRDIPKYGWYTLDGVRLQGRPVKKGIYIYNGKKRVITD